MLVKRRGWFGREEGGYENGNGRVWRKKRAVQPNGEYETTETGVSDGHAVMQCVDRDSHAVPS